MAAALKRFGKRVDDELNSGSPWKLEGQALWDCDIGSLTFEFNLVGDLDGLDLPKQGEGVRGEGVRKDGLWQSTCFEAFVCPDGSQDGYWELNLSPSGDWNVYRFSGYRSGMAVEDRARGIHPRFESGEGWLKVKFQLDLGCLFRSAQVGLTAVLQRKDGQQEFWALAHTGPKADFHRKDSFVLNLFS